jgi:MFS family permease
VTLCAVQFIDVLGVTVVVTALPSMLADLGAGQNAATWVVTGYAAAFGGLLLLAARLGDRYGHRLVLLAGLAGFAGASVIGATAVDVAVLTAARCLQGAAAAACVPSALRLLTAATPQADARRRALAGWSATGAVAGASGLLLGGAMTTSLGWPAVFWVNLPLAAALALSVVATVPRVEPERPRRPADLVGALLFTAAVGTVVAGTSLYDPGHGADDGSGALPNWALPALLVLTGAVLLLAFAGVERRALHPLLPGDALRSHSLRTGSGVSFVNTAATSSVVTLAALHLQEDRGLSAARAGVYLTPFSVCVIVGSALSARLLRRATPRAVAGTGLLCIAAGDGTLLASSAGAWLVPVAVGVAGAGIGVASVAATQLATRVPDELQGTAAGLVNTCAQLGTALGVAVILTIATATQGRSMPLAGDRAGWLVAAAVALLTSLAVLPLRRRTATLGAAPQRRLMRPSGGRQPRPDAHGH